MMPMTDRSTPSLGLLGGGPQIAAVVEAARARGWPVVAADDSSAAGDRPRESWTAFLDGDACDAVLVGADGWNAARAEAVRTLVQAGRTLVLEQPLELSMLWAFELDMIARDSGARLVPVLPDRLHPAVAALKGFVEAAAAGDGPLGPLESIRLERTLLDRSRAAVLAGLARDVDLARVLAGDPARVSTLGAADADSAWSTLAVGLTGPAQVPVRWQVAAGAPEGLRITLHHIRGPIEVFAPDGPEPWTVSSSLPRCAPFDRGAAILDQIARPAGAGRADAAAVQVPPASWTDAARALEIAETVPRSLARGRAIDLHHEEFSELGTFRGTMASLGCGIVLLALALVVIATLVAGISKAVGWEFGTALANAWPGVVLAALVVFLALQLLPMLLGPDRPPPRSGPPANG